MRNLEQVRKALQTPHGRFIHGSIQRVVQATKTEQNKGGYSLSSVRGLLCGYHEKQSPRAIGEIIRAANQVADEIQQELELIR